MTSLVPILHQCSLKLGCFSPFLLVKLPPLQPWPLPINYICSVFAAYTHGHKQSAEAFTFQAHLQILFDVDYWACVEPMGFHMLETWWSAKCYTLPVTVCTASSLTLSAGCPELSPFAWGESVKSGQHSHIYRDVKVMPMQQLWHEAPS